MGCLGWRTSSYRCAHANAYFPFGKHSFWRMVRRNAQQSALKQQNTSGEEKREEYRHAEEGVCACQEKSWRAGLSVLLQLGGDGRRW